MRTGSKAPAGSASFMFNAVAGDVIVISLLTNLILRIKRVSEFDS